MKFSKASIIITTLTFIIFGVSIANLVICINQHTSIGMGAGIAIVMLGVFVACLVTTIKDAKKNASPDSEDDDEDTDDDDDEDEE